MTKEQKEYAAELAKKLANYPTGFSPMDGQNGQEDFLFEELRELIEREKKKARDN